MTSHREALIEEAEAYARDGLPLPLDIISALMQEGIDHTQFTDQDIPGFTEVDPMDRSAPSTYFDIDDGEEEIHNVD